MKKTLALMLAGTVAVVAGFTGFTGCNRETEADKPEVRDLQLDIDVGESTDGAKKTGS